MRFKTLGILLAAPIMALSLSAQAEFVKTDWKVCNNQLAFVDEETGIEWLKMPESNNSSYNNTISLLDTTYDGWLSIVRLSR